MATAAKKTAAKTATPKAQTVEEVAQTTAVAVQQQGALVAQTEADAFAEFAGAGLENLGKDDLAIPFLVVLQSGSPQTKRSEGEYIEGAVEGMLFNTVTKAVIDPMKTPVHVVACAYDRNFVEWRLRENGGGFVRQHAPDPALMDGVIRDDKNRDILPNGNQINDTRSHYVLVIVGDEAPQPAFITMTSTQIKKSRQWLMQQNLLKLKASNGRLYTPPMFASLWRVTTVPESNEKGTWMGWSFEHAGYLSGPQDPVFEEAMAFHKSVAKGAIKADLSRAGDEVTQPTTGGDTGSDPDDAQF